MASEVCQHCMSPVPRDVAAVSQGYSYHKKCLKCYVCSETNLRDAEVFKGVIFCSGCAKRIFQGCSSARRAKTRPRHRRERTERHDRPRRPKVENRVIEMARLARSSTRQVSERMQVDSQPLAEAETGATRDTGSPKHIKRDSTEFGINTDVTNKLLKEVNCPIVIDFNLASKSTCLVRSCPQPDASAESKNATPCSDLRIAELGASTEIATMGLRKHSETTFNKSDTGIRINSRMAPSSVSMLSRVSDVSGDTHSNVEWLDSVCDEYRGLSRPNGHILNRHLGSLIKMPYKLFKKNIVMKSSLISVIMSSESEEESHRKLTKPMSFLRSHKFSFYKRFKMLFQEEVVDHQRKGLKRLYSTINKRKTPYRLGWLEISGGVPRTLKSKDECLHIKTGCKHFHASHSYRCMRAQVMRLAGPTKSEMKTFRSTVKNKIVPPFVKKIHRKKPTAMLSEACGSEGNSLKRSSNTARSL